MRVPGPLSERYIDSALSMSESWCVISGKANDSVEIIFVADAVIFNEFDNN